MDMTVNLNEKRLLEIYREVVMHGYGKIVVEIRTDGVNRIVIKESHSFDNQWTQPK